GQLIRALGRPCGVIGTLGASLDDAVIDTDNTTPDAVSLQQQLATWQGQGIGVVGMEVSSHALAQGRVNGVAFDTAVYTNLSHEHIDYHGSMEAYGRTKLRLFAWENLGRAVINIDDPFAARVHAAVKKGTDVVTYSTHGGAADVRVDNAEFTAQGVQGDFITPWGRRSFFCPLVGEFNLANFAAAVAVLVSTEEDLTRTLEVAASLQPIPGRMQVIPNALSLQVVVDYAHTPEALAQVLQALRPQVPGALITVFGCGGDRDREKRQLMGRIACAVSDQVVVTSDNPRTESPAHIMQDIEAGCSGQYLLIEDRAEAISAAVAIAGTGDCVVIAGKGHEQYQLIDGARLHFSDVEQANAALARRAQS
ncbi:MAG: UDP-N-acetylmuramoyl-L-alanyl-D-glutamate--2,6-diaminopimelate ligase, partial [Halioglobus sp.]|nr:UDP-N-acetylmuramoyl-L-alanyl-D-glutamate--2,6-diaminopimelate ligase [Halioglobus sp.]